MSESDQDADPIGRRFAHALPVASGMSGGSIAVVAACAGMACAPVAASAMVPPAAGAAGLAPSQCAGADEAPGGGTRRVTRLSVICLVNAERRARGLAPVRSHPRLQRAAFAHSVDMRVREYFGHVGPGGPSLTLRLRRAGYWPASAGENIAAGTAASATPRAAVEDWMASRVHRDNILSPRWREVGVGVVTEHPAPPGPGGTYTLVMGARKGARRAPRREPRLLAGCPGSRLAPAGRTRRAVRLAVICLINTHRGAYGLRRLADDPRLGTAAFDQSVDMRTREYLGHSAPAGGPQFAQRLAAAAYWPATAGELVAQATAGRATARQVVDAWLADPASRVALLSSAWRGIGVGVVTEHSAPPGPGGTYSVVLGRRTPAPGALRLPPGIGLR